MNKEQQIKQMMLDVPQNIVAYDGNPAGQHLYGEQRHQIAEALYNAGYRKIQDTLTNVNDVGRKEIKSLGGNKMTKIDECCDLIEAIIKSNQIYVATNDDEIGYYPTGCSMTQWNEDCEEIINEVERILNEYNLYDHDRNTNVANSNQLVTVLEILKKIK